MTDLTNLISPLVSSPVKISQKVLRSLKVMRSLKMLRNLKVMLPKRPLLKTGDFKKLTLKLQLMLTPKLQLMLTPRLQLMVMLQLMVTPRLQLMVRNLKRELLRKSARVMIAGKTISGTSIRKTSKRTSQIKSLSSMSSTQTPWRRFHSRTSKEVSSKPVCFTRKRK